MCGRFSLMTNRSDLARSLQISADAFPADLAPRYNIAPSQPVPILRMTETVKVSELRWGLIPSWARDPRIAYQLINARQETIAEKPSFRDSFRNRRCLVLADGFYEWRVVPGSQTKVPHYIRLKSAEPFTLAGLWSNWRGPNGEDLETCTIVTGEPNELVRHVHDRMPVILPAKNRDAWMDPDHRNEPALLSLLRPYDANEMELYPVSRYVNKPANEGRECIVEAPASAEPVDPPKPGPGPLDLFEKP